MCVVHCVQCVCVCVICVYVCDVYICCMVCVCVCGKRMCCMITWMCCVVCVWGGVCVWFIVGGVCIISHSKISSSSWRPCSSPSRMLNSKGRKETYYINAWSLSLRFLFNFPKGSQARNVRLRRATCLSSNHLVCGRGQPWSPSA